MDELLLRVALCSRAESMALKAAWTHAANGRMPPIEQAKLWALREVLRKQDEDIDQYTWMASQVRVHGGGAS